MGHFYGRTFRSCGLLPDGAPTRYRAVAAYARRYLSRWSTGRTSSYVGRISDCQTWSTSAIMRSNRAGNHLNVGVALQAVVAGTQARKVSLGDAAAAAVIAARDRSG